MGNDLFDNLKARTSGLRRTFNLRNHAKRYISAFSYIKSLPFNRSSFASFLRIAAPQISPYPSQQNRITHEFGLDPRAAFDFWRNELATHKEAYSALGNLYRPDQCISSAEFARAYVKQRGVNMSYVGEAPNWEDLSRLPAFWAQKYLAYNCFPLVLSILEKGFATYPSCLDELNRGALASSSCAYIINGSPCIAYLFERSKNELNSIICGGPYGMILATCTIKSGSAKIRWFGGEMDGPRSLQSHIDEVELFARQLLGQRANVARHLSRHQLSSLPPLCLFGNYNSMGHYIWNELPLLSNADKLPQSLHIAVGEFDFANLMKSHNSATKCFLDPAEITDITHSLAHDQVHLSARALVILSDIFSIGKQETKAVIHEHLDRLAATNTAAKTTINRLTVAIGLRITGSRQFLSTVKLIELIDSVFEDRNLQPFYYLDGYTKLPARPGFISSPSPSEAIAVKGITKSIPASILDRIIPYTIPTMADKRIILESCLCGFFPIGSSAIFQGWLTSIPAFYFDDGRYYNEFVQQDYICNYLKNSCYFIDPSLFCADPARDGYGIADSLALRDYLKLKIGLLLEEHCIV